jgi:hypothetical protein
MANLQRVRVAWTGTPVPGGGLSTFFFSAGATPSTFTGLLAAFFNQFDDILPPGITWAIPSSGDIIQDTDGALVGAWSGGSAANINTSGSGATAYAQGVGARMTFATASIHNRRRVRGSLFICPLLNTCYQIDGTIDTVELTQLRTAAASLVGDVSAPVIWSRPKKNKETGAIEVEGSNSAITGSNVPDTVSWLRSRRT